MRLPALLAAVPLLAGTAAGLLLADLTPERVDLASAAAAFFALLAGCGFMSLGFDRAVAGCVALGCALAGFSSGGSTARRLEKPPVLEWFRANPASASEPVTLVGVLRDDAAVTEHGVWLTVDALGACAGACPPPAAAVAGGVRLSVGGAPPAILVREWRAGRTLRVSALLREPTAYRNPGVADEARVLARRGIALSGSVKSASLVEVVASGNAVAEGAARVRAWTRRVLTAHVVPLSDRSAAVAIAILIGDRTGLSDEDERRLQDAGIYHVIAISGGNVAIFTAMLLFGARVIRIPPRAGALAAIAVLLFYGEVAGGAPSVSRAVSAAVIFLAAVALDHRGGPLNTVGVAAILGVSVFPAAVVDAGFLLSFVATAAIIAGVPPLVRHARGGRPLLAIAAATACAEVTLAPIAATFFSRVTAAGLIVNFAAVPLMTLVQGGSMALLAASVFSDAWANTLAHAVHWSAQALVESARFVDFVPWLARDVPAPAWWLCATYYAACLGLLVPKARRIALATLAASLGCLVLGLASTSRGLLPSPPAGVLRVVVLDVGQGDATVAIFPGGTAVLVDAGGIAGTTFDVAERVVVPALRALRIHELHALVVTHGDPDHVSGAEGVLRAMRATAVWEGVPVPPNPALRALSTLAREQRAVWRTVRPGDVDRVGDVEIRVLHPPAPDWERQRVRNDDSVVLELRYRDVSIVLPGDIGREVEHALVPSLGLDRTVILKAPHHGSATSSSEAFLDALNPRVVIFSAGRNNRFGHPAKPVVERYAARGVEMFNTVTDGAVFVETDGREVRVWGWGSGRTHFVGGR